MKPFRPTAPPAPLLMIGRTVASNVLFWMTLCLVGASGTYSDALHRHENASFGHMFLLWCRDHVPVCLLGIGLHLVNWRWPDWFVSARRVAAGYGFAVLVYLPLSLVFIAFDSRPPPGHAPEYASPWLNALSMPRFEWFVELAWTSGTYIGVVALCLWRRQRERERAWRQAEQDNLGLRLALEQQRLQALRGQLEPHFMFNALNAISALVRADDRTLALAGIQRLSGLLRYALAASEQEWVVLADELRFVRDYLDLQLLRHGERLRVRIEGDDADTLGIDCPPLLLQPLVENALRHGLDRHEGHGEVRIAFAVESTHLVVRIVNSLVADAPPNPGAGIGLPNVRARLATAYGAAARFDAGPRGGEFVAELRLPLDGADARPASPVRELVA